MLKSQKWIQVKLFNLKFLIFNLIENIAIMPTIEPEEVSIISQPDKADIPYNSHIIHGGIDSEDEEKTSQNMNGILNKQSDKGEEDPYHPNAFNDDHDISNRLSDDNVIVQQQQVPGFQNVEPDLKHHAYIPSKGHISTEVLNFKPDEFIIEQVKASVKYANNSLNFNDVDGAIKFLNDALMKLTVPPENYSSN